MTPITTTPLQIADYIVLPLQVPHLASSAVHYLYLRPHLPNVPHPDSQRSLFLANIPVDSTPSHFRTLFVDQLGGGRIERIDFEDAPATKKGMNALQRLKSSGSRPKKRKRGAEETDAVPSLPDTWDRELHGSGSTAVAVFVDRPSMDLAYKAARKATKAGRQLAWGDGCGGELSQLGSQRYTHHHALQYPPTSTLQASVDAYMTAFSALEASRARALIRQRSVPSADGFVTVTRGARTGPARIKEVQEKAEELRKKEEEKRKGMGDFYRFQTRERMKEEAGALVRRFEEDRKRVDEMRSGRGNRFKPA